MAKCINCGHFSFENICQNCHLKSSWLGYERIKSQANKDLYDQRRANAFNSVFSSEDILKKFDNFLGETEYKNMRLTNKLLSQKLLSPQKMQEEKRKSLIQMVVKTINDARSLDISFAEISSKCGYEMETVKKKLEKFLGNSITSIPYSNEELTRFLYEINIIIKNKLDNEKQSLERKSISIMTNKVSFKAAKDNEIFEELKRQIREKANHGSCANPENHPKGCVMYDKLTDRFYWGNSSHKGYIKHNGKIPLCPNVLSEDLWSQFPRCVNTKENMFGVSCAEYECIIKIAQKRGGIMNMGNCSNTGDRLIYAQAFSNEAIYKNNPKIFFPPCDGCLTWFKAVGIRCSDIKK